MSNYFDLSKIADDIFDESSTKALEDKHDIKTLSTMAPNAIQWVTGLEYWGAHQTFEYWRQYQIIRDLFNLRCKVCNSQRPDAIDCWDKSRNYLESEVLFEWSEDVQDFVCPKCHSTMQEHIDDQLIVPYNELICIAGMRSGKSFLGAHIGGYIEHVLRVMSMKGRGYIQQYFGLHKAEFLDLTFSASTATQAEQTIYAKYREMRNNSLWINKHVSFVKDLESRQVGGAKEKWEYKVKSDAIEDGYLQVRFNRIASDSAGAAGRTRVLGAIDEWARLIDTDGTRSAKELYAVINQSLQTVRAAVDNNNLMRVFGFMMNVTSAWAVDDPAMELYNKASEGELPRTYYWRGPTWDFNPKITKDNLAESFIKDRAAAERDFASNPPLASTPYVDNPHLFWKCIDYDRSPSVIFQETTVHDQSGKFYNAVQAAYCELDMTQTPYYAFMDAGLTWDCFGFAIGHGEWRSLEDFDIDQGSLTPMNFGFDPLNPQVYIKPPKEKEESSELSKKGFVKLEDQKGFSNLENKGFKKITDSYNRLPGYKKEDEVFCTVIDAVFRIIPSETNEIWYNSILDVVKTIQNRLKLEAIYSDRWNSASLQQQIRSNFGITADNYKLRAEDFMSFLHLAYQGRISLLPPDPKGDVKLNENGQLLLKTPQEEMKGSSVGIVEILKLNRSPDFRKFYNERKGVVRGRDSDDIARCIIGVSTIVQNSIVEPKTRGRRNMRQSPGRRLQQSGTVFNPYKK